MSNKFFDINMLGEWGLEEVITSEILLLNSFRLFMEEEFERVEMDGPVFQPE